MLVTDIHTMQLYAVKMGQYVFAVNQRKASEIELHNCIKLGQGNF